MWKWVSLARSLAACLGEAAVHSAPLSASNARLDWAAAAIAFAATCVAAGHFAAQVNPLERVEHLNTTLAVNVL